MTAKKRKFTKEETQQFKVFVRRAVAIAGTLRNLSDITGISFSTVQRLTQKDYIGTYATRARIETFVENNYNLLG